MLERITEEYVQQNRTKKGKARCPSCGGNDLGLKPEDKFAHCWECGINYRIGDEAYHRRSYDDTRIFDTDAIRALYADATEYYHGCIGKEQQEFLYSRGIDDNAIDLFKIGFCPPSSSPLYIGKTAKESGIADGKGNPALGGRIVFPYIAEGAVTDIRGRAMNDEGPRYRSLYHRSPMRGAIYPYNYDAALRRALETKTLILTEGEIKAVVADRNGFAIMAFPGMTSYRRGLVPQPGIKIVVIYDNTDEPSDRVRVDRAIFELSHFIPKFNVLTLPLLGQHKMDVDTFLLTPGGGKDRLQHMIAHSVEYAHYKLLRRF